MLDKDKDREIIIVLTHLFEKGNLNNYHVNRRIIQDLEGKIPHTSGGPFGAMCTANTRGFIEETGTKDGPAIRLTAYGEAAIRKHLGKPE